MTNFEYFCLSALTFPNCCGGSARVDATTGAAVQMRLSNARGADTNLSLK